MSTTKEELLKLIRDHNSYRICIEEIAESTCICEHVNRARIELNIPVKKVNMIDSEPCDHNYYPCYRYITTTGWFWSSIKVKEFDFAICTKCGRRVYEVGETVTETEMCL